LKFLIRPSTGPRPPAVGITELGGVAGAVEGANGTVTAGPPRGLP
jgi:hypothetical protein